MAVATPKPKTVTPVVARKVPARPPDRVITLTPPSAGHLPAEHVVNSPVIGIREHVLLPAGTRKCPAGGGPPVGLVGKVNAWTKKSR